MCSNSIIKPTSWIDLVFYYFQKKTLEIICQNIEELIVIRSEPFFHKVQEMVTDIEIRFPNDYLEDLAKNRLIKSVKNKSRMNPNIVDESSKSFNRYNKKEFTQDKKGNFHNITAGRGKSYQSTASEKSLSTNDLTFTRDGILGRIFYEQARKKWRHMVEFQDYGVSFKNIVSIPEEDKKAVENFYLTKDKDVFNSKFSTNKLKQIRRIRQKPDVR